jgi:hypothetical protein
MSVPPQADELTPQLMDPSEEGDALHGVGTLVAYSKDYVQRVKGGELGSLPALGGLIVITLFFSIVHPGRSAAVLDRRLGSPVASPVPGRSRWLPIAAWIPRGRRVAAARPVSGTPSWPSC